MKLDKSTLVHSILLSFSNMLAKLLPKKPRLVVFGASNGRLYADNSRHLYEWILINRPDLQPVWLTKSKSVLQGLKQQQKPVALYSSWVGIKYLAQSQVGVFTNSLRDLAFDPFWVPDSIRLVALRHGKSVKRVRFARLEDTLSDSEIEERLRESNLIDQVISTSEFTSDIQEECLQVGRHKHVVTGYPRNDMLLDPSQEAKKNWETYLDDLRPSKVVLYGPSWRHGREPTRFFPFTDFNPDQLIAFLQERNILLLLRPHLNDLRQYPELHAFLINLSKTSVYVRLASQDVYADVNLLLPFVDVLISDYSALYHDFLLLDRPLMFFPYDYEEFARQNGFLYDYFEYLPGPAIYTLEQFFAHLDCLSRGEDPYLLKRRILRDKIHYYQDAKSCQRVAELIDSTIKTKHE